MGSMPHPTINTKVNILLKMEETIFQEDPDLLELIRLASVGKSSIDRLSGKFLTPDGKKSKSTNFDPLALPVVVLTSDETDQPRPNKRLCFSDSKNLETKKRFRDEAINASHQLNNNDSSNSEKLLTKKLKRRKLINADSSSLAQSVVPIDDSAENVPSDLKSAEKSPTHHSPTPLVEDSKLKDKKLTENVENLNISSVNTVHIVSIPNVNEEKLRETTDSAIPPSGRLLRKRIRKTLPPLKLRQTPLGLPKQPRVTKDEFTIEEIYTNKNYATPGTKSWETIFEEPKQDKDGNMRYVEKKKKRRLVVFPTDPSARNKKKKVRRKRPSRRNKQTDDTASNERLSTILSRLDDQLLLNGDSP
uniref:uncharacterized protein LOC100181989 isoform X2 n=1 Tax=Ciona intestinalis TaxID=7719 RepID=UPI00006A72CC|nr:uncharacterized protein LOC100181989 isoform X2 [Ciona intestinalis]|eukprot:XP_002127231.1 uncharacterized protein LOC100181989 isoform X2 [Ciona intestinalis]